MYRWNLGCMCPRCSLDAWWERFQDNIVFLGSQQPHLLSCCNSAFPLPKVECGVTLVALGGESSQDQFQFSYSVLHKTLVFVAAVSLILFKCIFLKEIECDNLIEKFYILNVVKAQRWQCSDVGSGENLSKQSPGSIDVKCLHIWLVTSKYLDWHYKTGLV